MKCACCGRKKKLLESFENIGKGGSVCVDCSDILYRIHDAVTEKNIEEYKLRKKSIDDMVQKKKATEDFKAWFDTDFIKRNPMPDNKDK